MKNNNKQDCAAFRQWLYALTRNELLQAMNVEFSAPSSSYDTGGRSSSGSSSSQDYDLLMEMVQLQPPPPTPIHPRAVGFRPVGSRQFGLPVEVSERERLRRTQPRLFQWSERQSYYRPPPPPPSRKGGSRTAVPPPPQQPRFDMIARKKITPWGQVLSLGVTREQLEADDRIVRGSYIRKSPTGSSSMSSSSWLEFQDDNDDDDDDPKSIIRMIQVASRGYFLTTPGNSSPSSSTVFYAPWLKPTERWFSLSFYLASRYHVALWKLFSTRSSSSSSNGNSNIRQQQQQQQFPSYGPNILRVAIPAATQKGIRQALQDDIRNLNYLRDSLLWRAILNGGDNVLRSNASAGDTKDWSKIWDSLLHMPLLHTANQEQLRLKHYIMEALEHTLATEMEKMIMMQDTLDSSVTTPTKQPSKSSKKKKKKGGKRGRQKAKRRVSFEPDKQQQEQKEEEEDEDSSGGSDRGEGEKEIREPAATAPPYEYVENNTTPQERNRNIVFVLGILDGVLEKAFTTVGLSPTPSTFEAAAVVEKVERKGRGGDARKHSIIEAERREGTKTLPRPWQKQKGAQSKQAKKPAPVVKATKKQSLEARPAKKGPSSSIVRGKHPSGGNAWKNPPTKNPPMKEESTDLRMFPMDSQQEDHIAHPSPPFNVDWSVGASFVDHHNGQPIFLTDESTSALPAEFDEEPLVADDFPFIEGNADNLSPLDGWPFLSRYQARDQSILTDFFQTQEERIDDDEKLMAASTAASISSSTYKDTMVVVDVDVDEMDKTDHEEPVPPVAIVGEIDAESLAEAIDEVNLEVEDEETALHAPLDNLSSNSLSDDAARLDPDVADAAEVRSNEDTVDTAPECRSPSPEAPLTPPPTLSPILVSLADLKNLKNTSLTPQKMKLAKSKSERVKKSSSMVGLPGSLPNSPVPPQKNGLTPSWSREDLRISAFHDDSGVKAKRPQLRPIPLEHQQSYRAVAIKSLARPIASSRAANFDFRSNLTESPSARRLRESCAHSETALDGHGEMQHELRRQAPDDVENKSVTKDETTTITSALSHREQEDQGSVRDERNSFRDMCLTLGAEVSKLKAMLAAQRAASVAGPVEFQDNIRHPGYNPGPFDPNSMQPFFPGMQRGQRLGAMSDAGVHRGGDYESQVSEDEVYSEVFSKARADVVRRMSSSATVLGSDASVENNGSTGPGVTLGAMPVYDSVTVNGLQSRLTKDILRFLNSTSMQLRKQDASRRMTVERFSRLVNTIWPRAQVKLYGSHVSGLCLPSSDLDFVICLPAVHKNAPALAPGVLEGRNAINETSQKLLARELKGESWVDPRSIKLIERTVVPVIKVSTKDTRARMLQLDISFDSPEHHGLHANQMVAQILEELPLTRPLMLVMKQFLLDRGLLTSYTGGLSSYCLFLMVARYLQEQSPTCLDCGSLLMGFLDFHGNHFDPRATGISVYRREYFARPNYAVATYQAAGQPMWFPPNQHHVVPNAPSQQGPQDFRRRNSFSDTGSMDGKGRSQTSPSHQRPPRFQPARFTAATHAVEHGDTNRSVDHGRPFTFDPLFVEDPLSAGNNVGRNAFRIFQVQRAFSDAHRALVASLEWDIHSSGDLNDGADYPLLKCLLQSEDVLYEL